MLFQFYRGRVCESRKLNAARAFLEERSEGKVHIETEQRLIHSCAVTSRLLYLNKILLRKERGTREQRRRGADTPRVVRGRERTAALTSLERRAVAVTTRGRHDMVEVCRAGGGGWWAVGGGRMPESVPMPL
jgi:hypothetical protein